MAWLVAFNERLLDKTTDIPRALARLAEGLTRSSINLEDSHEAWKKAADDWLGHSRERAT
jgi:hypothetical protein